MLPISFTSYGEKMDLRRGIFHPPDLGSMSDLTLASLSSPFTRERF
jgi:hypothetical protein